MAARAAQWNVDDTIRDRLEEARTRRPPEYSRQMGWVLIAFQNALYELLHASTLEEGIIETLQCGGDTDTNGAICGALLGAVYGQEAVPRQWVEKIGQLYGKLAKGLANPRDWTWFQGYLRRARPFDIKA